MFNSTSIILLLMNQASVLCDKHISETSVPRQRTIFHMFQGVCIWIESALVEDFDRRPSILIQCLRAHHRIPSYPSIVDQGAPRLHNQSARDQRKRNFIRRGVGEIAGSSLFTTCSPISVSNPSVFTTGSSVSASTCSFLMICTRDRRPTLRQMIRDLLEASLDDLRGHSR